MSLAERLLQRSDDTLPLMYTDRRPMARMVALSHIREAYYKVGFDWVKDFVDELFGDFEKDRLIDELIDCLTHEDTHRQQDQYGSHKEPYVQAVKQDDITDKANDAYWSQTRELDAYARQVAAALEKDGVSKNEALETLLAGKAPVDVRWIVVKYHELDVVHWRSFLTAVYEYFME